MKTYWTTRDGRMVDVDEMSEQHLRNTLKMIIRKNKRMYNREFKLNGDMANEFNESQEMDEFYNELLGEYDAEDFGCK